MAENLAGLREAYALQTRLVDPPRADVEQAAYIYIAALEAQNAAQQQRIETMEKGLEPFAASYRGFMKTQTGFEIDDPFWEWLQAHADDELIGDHYQRAHDLLRSEKGGEG